MAQSAFYRILFTFLSATVKDAFEFEAGFFG
jgi:hypothetical protein